MPLEQYPDKDLVDASADKPRTALRYLPYFLQLSVRCFAIQWLMGVTGHLVGRNSKNGEGWTGRKEWLRGIQRLHSGRLSQPGHGSSRFALWMDGWMDGHRVSIEVCYRSGTFSFIRHS